MKRLLVEPLDVLMFRGEKPFIARESHVAKFGIIPLSTFEGALKSKVLLKLCEKINYPISKLQRNKNKDEEDFRKEIKEEVQKNDELRKILEIVGYTPLEFKSKINVIGVFFAEDGKEWFPVPNDIVKGGKKLFLLKPVLKEEIKIPGEDFYICMPENSEIEDIKGLISFYGFIKYLWGEIPEKEDIIQDIQKLYKKELRTGIKIEKRRKTTVKGYFYVAEFLRLQEGWKFIVWYEDYDDLLEKVIKEYPLIRLGGEGRGAICRTVGKVDINKKIDIQGLIDKINEDKKFKLYLASPAYFGGSLPNKEILKRFLGVDDLELVCALPGKPVYIGGYDFAMNKEKSLKKWVNAGAVYYYRFEGKIRDDIHLPLRIVEEGMEMRCAFIGRWSDV